MNQNIRGVERGLRRIQRTLHAIQRRPGVEVPEATIIDAFRAGSGPWPWDYLISPNYDGVEGAEQIVFGHTYKVYSTVKGAVDDANINRQTSKQRSTFGLVSGDHTVSVTVSCDPPTLGHYSLIGIGGGARILAGANSITVLNATVLGGSDPTTEFDGISFDDNAKTGITMVISDLGNRLIMRHGKMNLASSTNKGVTARSDYRGLHFDNFFIEGFGTHISSPPSATADHFFVFGLQSIGATIAVDLGLAQIIYIQGTITTATTGINSSLPTTINRQWYFDIIMNGCTTGYKFSGQHLGGANMRIRGSIGAVTAGRVGVDFSGLTSGSNIFGVDISCNFDGSSTGIGVKGPTTATFVKVSNIHSCMFFGFTSGNEIQNWAGSTNTAEHNRSVSSTAVDQPLADIGSPVGHSILSGSSAGEGISINETGVISVDDIHSNSRHHAPDTTLLSETFSIDSTGIKILTTAHGLGYIPAGAVVQLTVIEDTVVDDWSFDLLKIASVDATNVIAKIRVSAASGTGGATARLAIQIAGSPTYESVFFGWGQTPAALPALTERFLTLRNRRYRSVLAPSFASMLTLSLIVDTDWLQPPSSILPRKKPETRIGMSVITPSQLP